MLLSSSPRACIGLSFYSERGGKSLESYEQRTDIIDICVINEHSGCYLKNGLKGVRVKSGKIG